MLSFFICKNTELTGNQGKDVIMSEFKSITSQEELDAIVKARVAREREKFSDYEELKKKVADFETKEAAYHSTIEGLKTEKTELSNQLETANGELTQTKLQSAKQRIATEFGLPIDLADRLRGDDVEGFKADAELLAGYITPKQQLPPVKSNEPAVTDPKEQGWAEMARNLINKGE